jgi:hypothetical protein
MGNQQEHLAVRDGSYDKEAAETHVRKQQTISLSSPKSASPPRED